VKYNLTMAGLPIISNSFAFSVTNSVRGAGTVLPKMFGALVSTITSSTRNIKDEYVQSVSVSARNTYLAQQKALNKGVQTVTSPIPNSQPQNSDARNVYLQANKAQQDQKTDIQNSQFTNFDISKFGPLREIEIKSGRTGGFFLRAEPPADTSVVDETVNEPASSGGTITLFCDCDETGALILRDADGNALPTEHRESTVWNSAFKTDKQEFYRQLEANPGLIWRFDMEGANKIYEGHDILNALSPKVYQNVASPKQIVDEYGYTFHVPAYGPNENYTVWGITTEGGNLSNTIHSVDRSGDSYGLYGLTLEERDIFYAEVQKIFDQNGVQLDARKEYYRLLPSAPQDMPKPTVGCDGQPLPKDHVWTPFPGGWSWGGIDSPVDQTTVQTIKDAIIENSTLRALFEKAGKVRSGEIADDTLAQQYSIRVTDNEGNHLANDRIIIAVKNGNQVEMSVDQFSQMSRLDITKLLR